MRREIADITITKDPIFKLENYKHIYLWGLDWNAGLKIKEKLWYSSKKVGLL